MRKILSIFILSILSLSYVPSASAEKQPLPSNIQQPISTKLANNDSNQWMIKFKDSITYDQKKALFQKYQIHELSTIDNENISLVSFKNHQTKMRNLLSGCSEVKFIEPNHTVKPSYTPTDHSYSKQWYAPKIHMPAAWNVTLGSPDIKVAVIDAGMQTTHPDLKDKITQPYNAITEGTTLPINTHGTHVAGIIAAAKNKIGITGIAPNVKIIPVNVFQGDTADIYTVSAGIDYAVNAGADVINLSLTTEDYTEIMDDSIQSAIKKGVIVVAAVGNDKTSRPQYPAAFKHVIAVSATTKYDTRATFSNFGSYINLSAPGVDIYSTIPKNAYIAESGTSMAAPIVSGIAALILSKNPFLSPAEVTTILQKSSVDLGTKGWDKFYGYGRVDAYQALVKTPAPIINLTASSKIFDESTRNPLFVSFKANKGTKISVYIKNANNEVIRRLVMNKSSNGGTLSTSWDGMTDNQEYSPAGQVRVMIHVTNGKHDIYKGINIKVTPAT